MAVCKKGKKGDLVANVENLEELRSALSILLEQVYKNFYCDKVAERALAVAIDLITLEIPE